MSRKRQTRNSKKFKKAAASKRARMPKLVGGYGNPNAIESKPRTVSKYELLTSKFCIPLKKLN